MFKDYANVLIKDISKINTNTYKNKYNWNYILYLDTKNITNNTINHVKKYTSKDNIPNRAKRIVKKNDIIISTVRPIQEHYGILREIPKNLLVSTAFVVISPNNNIVDNDYLYYFLTQKYITKSLQDIAEQGTTSYPSITRKDIENIELVLPSLKYQRQISHILRNIDKKIATNKKINKNLDRLLEIIFDNWFIQYNSFKNNKFKNTNLRKISYNWNITEFGNIINKISSGKRPIIKVNNETNEFNIPIYGASSITGYTNDWLYDKPVLIIGRVGTLGSIQRSINKSFPSDNTLVISPKYYNYTYQILKKIDHNSYNVGSTQPLIRQKDLLKIKIILPPRDIIEEYEKISNRIMKCILKNKLEIEKLTKLRDILLPKLMSGEIDVSNIEI